MLYDKGCFPSCIKCRQNNSNSCFEGLLERRPLEISSTLCQPVEKDFWWWTNTHTESVLCSDQLRRCFWNSKRIHKVDSDCRQVCKNELSSLLHIMLRGVVGIENPCPSPLIAMLAKLWCFCYFQERVKIGRYHELFYNYIIHFLYEVGIEVTFVLLTTVFIWSLY